MPGEWGADGLAGGSDGGREVAGAFAERFGRRPVAGARAPGRVNLIGEHTDYNEGLVLPFAIDRATIVWLAPRADDRVRVYSESLDQEVSFERATAAAPAGFGGYVWAALAALAERGAALPGIDALVASTVPLEAGLSSSAALTVSVVMAAARLAGFDLDAEACARTAHRAESHFLRVGSGILDPFASALSRRDHALRIDCRDGSVVPVAMPAGRVRVLVADSGVRRALADSASGYRRRVAECRAALEAARETGVAGAAARSLRDVDPSDLRRLEIRLAPVPFRRLRHVLRENERVDECRRALEAGDLAAVGAVLREGHRSLRDDYEVSTPELDALCEIADAHPAVYGSRLTGAGFGGCTLHLVEPDALQEVQRALADGFEQRFARRPPVHPVASADGAAVLDG